MNISKIVLAISISLLSVNIDSQAKVTLPSVFTDNMVLQQKTSAAVWGKADPGKKVTVSGSWNSKIYTAVADNGGNWKVAVPTPSYGGPYTLKISDGEVTTLKNILIGDVWVCSGQSNMEMAVGPSRNGRVENYERELAKANYPEIRLLRAEHATSNVPLDNAQIANGGWQPCSPVNVSHFSAAAYFFAREIYQKNKVPIGLIQSTWGGTIAEAWTSGETLKKLPDFAEEAQKILSSKRESKEDYDQKVRAWENAGMSKDAGYANGNPAWAASITDVSSWQNLNLPGSWTNTPLAKFDGAVWFRKKITVPASWAGKELKLNLGLIDDDDITWFNGEQIGAMKGSTVSRKYIIPANKVKTGENVITVRVFDAAGGGGFLSDPHELTIATAAGSETISVAGDWQYKIGVSIKDFPPKPPAFDVPNRPTVLYNAMIHPFIQFANKGFIWYQGESNARRAYQYRELFPALIKDWRQKWGGDAKPFYFVQLANYLKVEDQPGESAWAELREAQARTLSLPNTGMAVSIDIGDATNIHPKNKQDVGKRLAYVALAKTYGVKMPFSGPVYQSHTIEGNTIKLNFMSADGGLKTKNNEALKGFAIAGADKKFYWANATIRGSEVIVSSPDVPNPVAVRYAWANNPVCNLISGANLPASPFRTDDWNGITFGKK